MKLSRIVPSVLAVLLLPLSTALLAQESPRPQAAPPQPASFDRLSDLLSRDQVAGSVAELAAIAVQSWPDQPTLGSFEQTTLRKAIETGRSHLAKAGATPDERLASRWLVCLARGYFPDDDLPAAVPPGVSAEPRQVGGEVSRPEVLGRVKPRYSLEARQNRVSGTVILKSVIDQEGCVRKTRVLKGQPYGLDEEALAALRNWVFEPAKLNGKPVKVYYVLTVNFKIEEDKNGTEPLLDPPVGQSPR
jgi:TonB family protein